MAFFNQQPPSYDDHSTLTPYLTLPHLLSLTWLAYPILSLIFVAFRLTSSLDSTQNAIESVKGDLLASCKAAEEAATSAASMPRYMALATNEQYADAVNASLSAARQALTLSLTVMEGIINFIIDLYRSIFLCFLELVVRGGLAILLGAVTELNNVVSAVGVGLRERIQTDIGNINNVIRTVVEGFNNIPLVPDVEVPQFDVPDLEALNNIQLPSSFSESIVRLNETIPTVSDIKEKLQEIIGAPFELLRQDINDTFATIQFTGSGLPVPQQNKIAFCDRLDMSVVDDIGKDILKAFKIGIVILVVIALVLIGLNCLLTWYKWRCMKNQLEYTRQAWMTDPTMIHSGKGSMSSTPQVTLSDHNLLILHANSSHPLVTRITNVLLARFRLSPKHHTNLQWFFNYIFHPPAAACLLIGVFGLMLVEIQLLAMGPMVAKYQGQAAETARDFSTLIATSINDSMFSQSRAYAAEVNLQVDTIQTRINDGLFSWVDTTTTQLNTTINEFYDDLQAGVTQVFGNTILATPATEFIRCLIGSKVDAIENALTFLNENLNVDIPRVSEDVLILSPESVNEASAPIAAAALGGGAEDDDGGLVGRLVNSYASTLKKERITFAIFVGLWGVVVLMGLLIIFWHSYGRNVLERRGRRRYAREQQDNLSGAFFNNGVSDGGKAPHEKEGGSWKAKQEAANSPDLPQFTPLPSPLPAASKPSRVSPDQSGETALRNEGEGAGDSLERNGDEKVSRMKALRLKLKQSGAASNGNLEDQQEGESSGVPRWFGKVKGAFTSKPPEPEPDFWRSYNDRPRLKIIVDTPSDQQFSDPGRRDSSGTQQPMPSRWSTSPPAPKHEFGWRNKVSPSKKGPSDSSTSLASAASTVTTRRLPPPPPGLRPKVNLPSQNLVSNVEGFSDSSIVPTPYPIPLHSDPFAAGSPNRSSPSSKVHNRTSSVPVWRVTNFSPSDQASNSSTASIPDMVRGPPMPPPPASSRTLLPPSQTATNPFMTPFDDERRVEIRNGAMRKSMSANPFVNPGVAL